MHRWFIYLSTIARSHDRRSRVTRSAPLPPAAAKSLATVQSVKVTSNASGISVEIAASQPVALRSQLATDPDRLVLDFPNAQPAGDLHSKLLNQGEIKGFRVARFSENPPTTRVVIDLNSPQHYQIFPDGKTVIVKLMSDQQQAAAKAHLDNVAYHPDAAQARLEDGRPLQQMDASASRPNTPAWPRFSTKSTARPAPISPSRPAQPRNRSSPVSARCPSAKPWSHCSTAPASTSSWSIRSANPEN